jgi:hypothetical protein
MNTIKIAGMITLIAAFTLISCHKMDHGNQTTARAVVEKSFSTPILPQLVVNH